MKGILRNSKKKQVYLLLSVESKLQFNGYKIIFFFVKKIKSEKFYIMFGFSCCVYMNRLESMEEYIFSYYFLF